MGTDKPRIPGFQDGGNAVESTTGNDVPIGSLPNEVADDIPARLSEGEFVLPADVVRFIGLERLMKLRDEAKEGLRRMAEVGQMGNAEDVGEKAEESFEEEGGEEEDTGKFESDIDEILSEVDSTEGQTEQAFAQGGVVGGAPWIAGTDLTKAPKNPVFDVRYYKHSDGRIMYVTFFNGKPMMPIPEGFTATDKPVEQQVGKEAEAKKTEEQKQMMPDVGGGIGSEGAQPSEGASAATPMQLESFSKALQAAPFAAAKLAGKALEFASGKMAQAATAKSMEAISKEAQEKAPSSPASASKEASNAAVAAADAAIAAGHSNAASNAAANAAAQAVNNGLSAQEASSVAAATANSVDAAPGVQAFGMDVPGGEGPSGAMTGGPDGMDIGPGFSFKKGGLVSKRQKPMKKSKGKGLAAR